MIGQTISHYRITEKLGGGGMGVVYGAEDTNLGRPVAIKFLPEDSFDDEAAAERFRREARAASALNHPHICTIHDLGEHGGVPFLAMERLEGRSLRDLLAERRLAAEEALRLGDQVADALSAAHARGIVHRDVKPENLFVTDRGDAKVLDFGLAKELTAAEDDETLTQLTREGSTVGTLTYMSPEQILGGVVNSRSDIFSLGVVLYEMLAGAHPFRRGHQMQTVDAILHQAPPPLRASSDLPGRVAEVVERMLAKNPDDRYQSLEEVRADLGAHRPRYERGKGVKRPAHIGIALVLVGLLALFGWLGRRGDAPGAVSSDRASPGVSSDSLLGEVEPNSIAVLPFRNLSPDPENAFFADGMTEELTSRLSRLGDLTVVASSSVMRYHDSSLTPAAVGEELRVASVLDGSVRRAGDDVRITGQLIDVASQQNLWSNTYQRRLEDIFRVQSEVAEEIVAALELELEPDEAAVLTRQPTGNLSAYDLFLRGVHYADRGRKDDNELAIGFFDRAIAEAPDFALAFAARSRAYERRASLYGFPRRWLDAALEDAERAVDLDPTLPDAQTALARALFSKGLLEASLEANLRAVELEPNNQSAARSLGWLYSEMGQPDEALRWYKRAVRLDPANAFRYALVGLGYVDLAMHHAAETWLARSLELAPDSLGNRNVLAVNYLNQERFADAAAVGEEILAISPGEPMGLTIVGIARHMAGDLEAAETYYRRNLDGVWAWYRVRMLLARILWDSGRRDEALEVMAPAVESLEADLASGSSLWWTFYSLAQAEAIRGDDERAYELLEQAVDAGATSYVVYRNDPCFGEILEEERHQRLMAEIESRVDQMRFRVQARERGAAP